VNKNNALPLKRDKGVIAVMGPNANDSVMQWGNYNGTPRRTTTILEGIKNAVGNNGKVIYEKGCDLVERTLLKTAFNNCVSSEGPGFTARYWNNKEYEGDPVASDQITTPFNFQTAGATVFAPGVNLTDFSAVYTSVFTPETSGEVEFDFYACGHVKLYVNEEEVRGVRANHGARRMSHLLKVKEGESYDIKISFEYTMGDAQLNFDLGFKEHLNIAQSIERIKEAGTVIFVGGISPALEGEEMGVNLPGFHRGDRTEIELPDVQREFIQALHDAGKKVILVNCSGSPIALEPEVENCDAILQAWYPGQSGGTAVAEVLFGDYNPAGRLPVTFYKNIAQLPDFEDYNMVGRTYRYMTEEPLFSFGHGLSYSTFKHGLPTLNKKSIKVGESVTITIPVRNESMLDGEEVVQVYLRKKDDPEGPHKTLRAFKRVNVQAGETKLVDLELSAEQLEWWNASTAQMEMQAGTHEILVGSSSHASDLQSMNLIIL
jgi:beta-glucosidase